MPKPAAGAGPHIYVQAWPTGRTRALSVVHAGDGWYYTCRHRRQERRGSNTRHMSRCRSKRHFKLCPRQLGSAWPPGAHTISKGISTPMSLYTQTHPSSQHSGQACTRCCESANSVSVSQAPGQHANTSVGLCAAAQQQPTSHVKLRRSLACDSPEHLRAPGP